MKRLLLAVAALLLLPAWALAGQHQLPAPAPTVPVTVGTVTQQVWPYTYQAPNPLGTPSDPVNLVFGNTDPREIRQALLVLDGNRTAKFPNAAPFNCTWVDAMGYDQAAWAEAEGWVGGVVQLACISDPMAPFGNPFRYHLRLFREGNVTLGAAHFEFLIPGTAEHEVLGWNPARDLVAFDMGRTGSLIASPGGAPMGFPATFRTVQRAVYDALVAGGATQILGYAGLYPAPVPGAVPMPLDPVAYVLTASIPFHPVRARTTTPFSVTYGVIAPKPFCNTPADYVKLEGPLHFLLKVQTDRWGTFSRSYEVQGVLKVTPLLATASGLVPNGPTVPAKIAEFHWGAMTDRWDQVFEEAGKTLMGKPRQSLQWILEFGEHDRVVVEQCCDTACGDEPHCGGGH
jgi:hypothetical protein